MSDPYKILEEQLGGAVRARRPRRWWTRGAVPVVIGVAVLGSGAATAAVVLRPDDRPENQVKQALWAGERATRSAAVCRRVHTRAPKLVDEPAPAWLTAQLGLLRRAPVARDRLPVAQMRLGGTEVLRASVRVARASDGWGYRFYLSRGVPQVGPGAADPVACARVRERAANAAAKRFPEAVRAEVATTVGAMASAVVAQAAGKTLSFTMMEVRPDGRVAGGGGGFLRAGRLPATGSIGTFRRGNRRFVALSGLVPDGVASVRILDRDGSPRERPRVVRVNDNVYHALLPRRFGPHLGVQWRAPSGRVIRTTHAHY